MPSNTTRIAKNTLALYFRQILIMLVSLYTVRVVLETLGAEDYGIYNVVAGVVTMFGFLSGAMATASQRYFSFEIGRGDFKQLKRVFNLSLTIYFLIVVLVLLLAETAGFWFVNNKLVIPLERKNAALWVYQTALISFVFAILNAPYMALIIAHEDMNIYAYMSILEMAFKLGIVFLLKLILLDKLQLYGILMCIVTIINTMVYQIICMAKYQESKFRFCWDKSLFKEITSYIAWNLFGSFVGIFKNQAITILLNQFFNPVIIAARGIASSVNGATVSFSQNFSTAIRPQIIKSYAAGQKRQMFSLMFRGVKGTYLLMYVFVLPLVIEMPIILRLWLKNPPEYTIFFTRLALLDALIDSISYPIMTALQATGKIRLYQSVVGGILLLNLPVSWIILIMGDPAYSVIIVAIIITFIAVIARLIILKIVLDYSMQLFLRTVILPLFIISILSAVIPVMIYYIIDQSILQLVVVISASVLSVSIFSYYIGWNYTERQKIKNIVLNKFQAI